MASSIFGDTLFRMTELRPLDTDALKAGVDPAANDLPLLFTERACHLNHRTAHRGGAVDRLRPPSPGPRRPFLRVGRKYCIIASFQEVERRARPCRWRHQRGNHVYPGAHARARADQPAVIMAGSGEIITYADLESRTNRLAHFLRANGLRHRDHYSIFMENNARYVETCGAGERTGLYYTCVNSFLTPDELAYILANSEVENTHHFPGETRCGAGSDAELPEYCTLFGSGWTRRRRGGAESRRGHRGLSGLRRSRMKSIGQRHAIFLRHNGPPEGHRCGRCRSNRPAEALPVYRRSG